MILYICDRCEFKLTRVYVPINLIPLNWRRFAVKADRLALICGKCHQEWEKHRPDHPNTFKQRRIFMYKEAE